MFVRGSSGGKAVEVIRDQVTTTLDFSSGHREGGETRGKSTS